MKEIMWELIEKFNDKLISPDGFRYMSESPYSTDEHAGINLIFEEIYTGNCVHVQINCDTEDIWRNESMDERVLKTLKDKLLVDREVMEEDEIKDLESQIKYMENKVG